uniref:Uncharacterized protein n=1 Tax=Romanomermis culicivorax TaxID=13658 RepID=A0A915I7W2_ROMCU
MAMLHERYCGSPTDIAASILGILGIVVPQQYRAEHWNMIPWNLRENYDMVTNCDVDNALWADQPPNDWIPHPTIRDLNQVYCSGN